MQTKRDAAIVDWVARIGAAGAQEVMARFGMGRSCAYARLRRLVADGLLEQRALLYRQPGLYVATAEGLRCARLERLGVFRLSAGGFEHARRLAGVAVELHRVLSGWRQLCERELRVAESDAGGLVGSVRVGELPGGRPAVHRPDLVLIAPDEGVWAVEVELSVKAPRRLEAICRGYARARHLQRVVYLAAPAPARAVARAVGQTRAQERIVVLALEDTGAVGRLVGEGVAGVRV